MRGLPDPPPDVHVVSFDEFVGTEEPTAEALLGTSEATILPVGGMLLMYGDGGAGKTTMSIDAVCHMGSATPWLGMTVERIVRSLVLENEGPRGKFRRKLAEKAAAWNGHPRFNDNVVVMEDPWTMFSLREESHRMGLADAITRLEVDLVVMGPLVTLGMVGGGTPDEVSDFEALIRATRQLVERPFALWIVHHENKAGDVAGAWERVPDCLLHVQAQGNGHTRVVFRKARWADESHGKKLDLKWTVEGRSYEIKDPDDRDLHADLLEAFRADDAWRTTREAAKLISANHTATIAALSDLVEREEMTYMVGPPGRSPKAQCYRIESVPNLLEHPGTVDDSGTGEDGVFHRSTRKSGTGGRGTGSTPVAGSDPSLTDAGTVDQDDTTTPAF